MQGEQLELFPNDLVRYATSLTLYEYGRLKERQPEAFYRIRAIREIVAKHNAHIRHLEKRMSFDIERAMNWA